jgi:hypothetical protein
MEFIKIMTERRAVNFFDPMKPVSDEDWSRYDANHVVFKPALMTESQLMEGYITAYKRFYSLSSIAKRLSGKRKDFFEILALNLGRFMNRKYFEEGCRI